MTRQMMGEGNLIDTVVETLVADPHKKENSIVRVEKLTSPFITCRNSYCD